MSDRPTLLLVSPRAPHPHGNGDQVRAHQLRQSLLGTWDIEVVSWLDDTRAGMRARLKQIPLAALPRLLWQVLSRPLPAAYVQSLAPRRRLAALSLRSDLVVYVTDRAVPGAPSSPFVIDFVDDLGGAALERAKTSPGIRCWFWLWQASMQRRFDRRLARRAALAIAISERDAAAISAKVVCVPNMVPSFRGAGGGEETPQSDIVFTGNLFFEPNHEAAVWICQKLVPELAARGIPPGHVVVAGRRPRPGLRELAEASGVRLVADFEDVEAVLVGAAVVVAPMLLGSGMKNKVLEAVAAGRPCVMTPSANEGVGLENGISAVVCERDAVRFALAISQLMKDGEERQRMALAARAQLQSLTPAAVTCTWLTHFEALRPHRQGATQS